MEYLRYQSTHPSPSGRFPGVFAIVNGLAFSGSLSENEQHWWQISNKWFEMHLTNPAKMDRWVFARSIRPYTSSWFRSSAVEFVQRTGGYLDILEQHGVDWVELQSTDPGPIVYSDEFQVVVATRHDPERLGDGIVIQSRSQSRMRQQRA